MTRFLATVVVEFQPPRIGRRTIGITSVERLVGIADYVTWHEYVQGNVAYVTRNTSVLDCIDLT